MTWMILRAAEILWISTLPGSACLCTAPHGSTIPEPTFQLTLRHRLLEASLLEFGVTPWRPRIVVPLWLSGMVQKGPWSSLIHPRSTHLAHNGGGTTCWDYTTAVDLDISGRPSPYPHPLRATPKRWALRLFRMVSAVLSTAATLHGLEWFQQGIPRTSKFLLIHRTLAFIIDRIGFSIVCTFSFSIHLWITFHRTCSLLSHFQASPPPQRHHGNRSFQSVQIKK